jgi:hypothetical protein
MVVIAMVVVATVVVAVLPAANMSSSKIVFPMPRQMGLQQNSKSKIATILYMEAVAAVAAVAAVKIPAIQEVVIQAAKKTIKT